jgi:hypothetical protein
MVPSEFNFDVWFNICHFLNFGRFSMWMTSALYIPLFSLLHSVINCYLSLQWRIAAPNQSIKQVKNKVSSRKQTVHPSSVDFIIHKSTATSVGRCRGGALNFQQIWDLKILSFVRQEHTFCGIYRCVTFEEKKTNKFWKWKFGDLFCKHSKILLYNGSSVIKCSVPVFPSCTL